MASLVKMIQRDIHHYILALLLVVFIVFDSKIPSPLQELVDTLLGKVLVIIGAFALLFAHPVLGALGVVAAYHLIALSEPKTPTKRLTQSVSSVRPREILNARHQFPVTVEEQVVHRMLPRAPSHLPPSTFKPILDPLHNASRITSSN